jgi:hypothetical protein
LSVVENTNAESRLSYIHSPSGRSDAAFAGVNLYPLKDFRRVLLPPMR